MRWGGVKMGWFGKIFIIKHVQVGRLGSFSTALLLAVFHSSQSWEKSATRLGRIS
jgi:hypothetical protein